MNLLNRSYYLKKLIELKDTPDIKVITGVRRSGKSILLSQYIDYLKSGKDEINIIYINLQDIENEKLLEYHALNNYIMDNYKKDMNNYLLIDEIQMCDKFEYVINSLHTKGIFDIYITGSNAFLLSSDLATLFTGRTMTVEVFPFSFNEFVQYYKNNKDIESLFEDYIKHGGMPGSFMYKDNNDKYSYLENVYNTILIIDLIKKYNIRNEDVIKKIFHYMLDNIGNLLSPNNICNYLNIKKRSSDT